MIVYLLKSATCLALLLAFYHLVLEKEKMHNFNRFYLLGSVIFSFLAPLYIIYIDVAPIVLDEVQTSPIISNIEITPSENTAKKPIDYASIITVFYVIISSILLFRFGRNLFNIIKKIRKNEKTQYQKATLVLVNDQILPHTFWNYIFINKQDYENKKIEKDLFTHELTHVTQKHTLDVLILELIQSIFWINPFFILLKKAVQLNHEFLADERVINKYKNTFQDQHLLLNKAAWKNEYYLASNLNYSLTKKRLKMMTTQSTPYKILLKKLALIPLLIGFIFLFAERVEAQEKQKNQRIEEIEIKKGNKKVKKHIESPIEKYNYSSSNSSKQSNPFTDSKNTIRIIDIRDKLKEVNGLNLKYSKKDSVHVTYNKLARKYNQDSIEKRIVKQKDLNKLETLYKKLSKEEKKFSQPFTKLYSETDSTRHEEFRQIIQEINDQYSRRYDLDSYKELNKKYEFTRNEKPHFIKSTRKRQKELEELFSKIGGIYFKLTKENKKKVKKPIHPHSPYLRLMKNNKVFYKLRSALTEEDKLLIPPLPPLPNASKEEISKAKQAYERWKKRTGNDIPPPPPPISPLDQIVKMAKKGAKFYYEKKEISSDKAIELLKRNKNLNIHSESINSDNYKVWISKKPK